CPQHTLLACRERKKNGGKRKSPCRQRHLSPMFSVLPEALNPWPRSHRANYCMWICATIALLPFPAPGAQVLEPALPEEPCPEVVAFACGTGCPGRPCP